MLGLSIEEFSKSSAVVFPVITLSFILNFKQLSSFSGSAILRNGLLLVISGLSQAPLPARIDVLLWDYLLF